MGKTHNPLAGLAQLAAEGKSRDELARHYGVCAQTVKRVADLRGIVLSRKSNAKPTSPRDTKILSMHRQGINMTKIGVQMGITRERVRQILKGHGITGHEVMAAQKVKRADSNLAAREARCMSKYGLNLTAYRAAVTDGHTDAFIRQRNSANARGIDWSLSLADWLSIWEESGKIDLRGRGVGRYVMSRVCDSGGYAFGNVHIQLSTENNSEFMFKNAGKRNAVPGVYLIYPGLAKPWVAKAGKKYLGCFATEQEATEARSAFLAERPPRPRRSSARLGTGRGYYRAGDKFRVVVGPKHIGQFKTEGEAIAARQAALAQYSLAA